MKKVYSWEDNPFFDQIILQTLFPNVCGQLLYTISIYGPFILMSILSPSFSLFEIQFNLIALRVLSHGMSSRDLHNMPRPPNYLRFSVEIGKFPEVGRSVTGTMITVHHLENIHLFLFNMHGNQKNVYFLSQEKPFYKFQQVNPLLGTKGFRKKCVFEEYKYLISFHSFHKIWMNRGAKALILLELQELSIIPYIFLNPHIKTSKLKAHIEIQSTTSFFKITFLIEV